MSVVIRPIGIHDIAAVAALAGRVPTAPHWPEFEYRRMVRITESQGDSQGAWVAVDDELSVGGFAMASQVAGIVELESVVTAPERRRQGIGLALAEAVLAWGRALGAERAVLEARVSNTPALRLYAQLGFQQDGVRRAYYRNPDEDAILLSLPFEETQTARCRPVVDESWGITRPAAGKHS